MGYLLTKNVNSPDLFLEDKKNKANFLVRAYHKAFGIECTSFLLKNHISEILQKSNCTEYDLADENFFKSFLSQFCDDEKEFISEALIGGKILENESFLKKQLPEERTVTLKGYKDNKVKKSTQEELNLLNKETTKTPVEDERVSSKKVLVQNKIKENAEIKKIFLVNEDDKNSQGLFNASEALKVTTKEEKPKHDDEIVLSKEVLVHKNKIKENEEIKKIFLVDHNDKNSQGSFNASEAFTIKFGQRYVRKNFIGSSADKKLEFKGDDFGDNSFANCTFTNCDFSKNSGKRINFVNCTFGEGCILPENLSNKNNNFAGCKFHETLFTQIQKIDNLKARQVEEGDAVAGNNFYKSEKPSNSISQSAISRLELPLRYCEK